MRTSRRVLLYPLLIVLALVVLAAVSPPSRAGSRPGTDSVSLTDYESRSRAYSLSVNPNEGSGKKGAVYRLSHDGDEVWSGPKPYTLRDVVVTDAGLAVGFAYRTGAFENRWAPGEPRALDSRQDPPKYLHIVILACDGTELLNDVYDRVHAPFYSTPPSPLRPYLEQLLVDSDNDRVIARVQASGSQWWVYRLSTGKIVHQLAPRNRMGGVKRLGPILDARLVVGTSLLLVHWYDIGAESGVQDDGGLFTLFDQRYRPVWSFKTKNDYAELEFQRYGVLRRPPSKTFFMHHPGILSSTIPGTFSIRSFVDNKEILFGVRDDGNGRYVVSEIDRRTLTNRIQ